MFIGHHQPVSESPRNIDSSILWDQENNQIMSLVLTSVERNIGLLCCIFLLLRLFWEHLEHMYFGSRNVTRIHGV